MRKIPVDPVFIRFSFGAQMDLERPKGSVISQTQFSYVQHAQKQVFKFMQDGQWKLSLDRVSFFVIAGL